MRQRTLTRRTGWAGTALAVALVGIRARGTCPRRSIKQGLGDRDVTVTMAGADLSPGMWLWADGDGMVLAAGPLG